MAERRPTLRPTDAPLSRLALDAALNDAQRAAVETTAPRVLILAGAGSGKTRTLTYRVARLVEQGVPPDEIVLVTFTNRAAREMIARVDQLLGATARRVRAGTFHGLAHAALRRHGAALGWAPGFAIVDRDDQVRIMGAAITDAGIDVEARRFPSADVLLSTLSLARSARRPPIELVAEKHPRFAPLEAEIDEILDRYTDLKRAMNVADFDDLLDGWIALLDRSDDLGARLRDEVRHVLVDEYQDTNRVQAELTERLASAHGHATVVGDDAQSIYAFRGAALENLLDFPRRGPTEVHTLTTSYRATPELLALANASIRHNPLQLPKALVAVRRSGPRPVLVGARDAAQEAEFVAQRALELRDEGVPLAAQAVLYRAHGHALELELALTRRDLPYAVRSGARLFEQAHVRDALAFLRVVANPADDLAWRRVFATLPGVGAKSAARLSDALDGARVAGRDPIGALGSTELRSTLSPRAARSLGALVDLLDTIRRHGAEPGPILRALVEDARFREHLEATYTSPQTRADELLRLADVAAGSTDLAAFLSDAVLNTEHDTRSGAQDARERLTLSTIHQAKGLEWRAVFLVGLADGGLPIQGALDEPGGEAEERRLFYVAVTRAMEQLYLTHPLSRTLRDRERVLVPPSRFLTELAGEAELVERWLLEEP